MFMRLLSLSLLMTSTAAAQIGSAHDYTPAELRQHFRNAAESHQMTVTKEPLKLQEMPLMNWSNPVRNREQGSLYVWSKAGRPQALASIFTFGHEDETICRHEMISLSEHPIRSTIDDKIAWDASKPGVTWKPVPQSPAPASTATRRLVQMRMLARRFSGKLFLPDRAPTNLQLIPQPLHRWTSKSNNVVDGALFSFAVATDPEMFLLLEAAGETSEWKYAIVRSHFFGLEMQLDGESVRKFDGISELLSTKQGQSPWSLSPYFTFFEAQALPAPETLR